jgi:hypothetical protein
MEASIGARSSQAAVNPAYPLLLHSGCCTHGTWATTSSRRNETLMRLAAKYYS